MLLCYSRKLGQHHNKSFVVLIRPSPSAYCLSSSSMLFILVLHLLFLERGKKKKKASRQDEMWTIVGFLYRNLPYIFLILFPLLIFLLLSISNSWYPPVAAARSVARRNFIDLCCWEEHPLPHLLRLLFTLDALHRCLLKERKEEEEVGWGWPAWLPAQRLASR